jgi:selenide,water dikinase
VDPARVRANAGSRPGDALLLTKAIGTGIISTALKFDRAPKESIDAAIRSMTTLNRAAAGVLETLTGDEVRACTDVTGFGLIGHASEMAAASGCSLEIEAALVPLIEGARSLVRGNVPGGGLTNREHFGAGVSAPMIDPDLLDLLYDPQTSGGLLVAVAAARADAVRSAMASAGVPAVVIGRAVPAQQARILII